MCSSLIRSREPEEDPERQHCPGNKPNDSEDESPETATERARSIFVIPYFLLFFGSVLCSFGPFLSSQVLTWMTNLSVDMDNATALYFLQLALLSVVDFYTDHSLDTYRINAGQHGVCGTKISAGTRSSATRSTRPTRTACSVQRRNIAGSTHTEIRFG